MVARPAVAKALDDTVAAVPLTVISAPTGFGKTVAVAQWVESRQLKRPGSVSWLAFTHAVADRSDVLQALLIAVQRAAYARHDQQLTDAVAEVFESASLSAAWTGLAGLHSAEPLTIVIDDFQFARGALGDSALELFVDHAMPWLKVVVILTEAVPPAWARARVHGQLAVIDASLLAFDAEEVHDAATRLGCDLDDDQVAQIMTRTGGWPSAVRLSIVGGAGSALVGDDADLTDYIRSAVLDRLPRRLAEFVSAATVVDRLDDELACALSNCPDGSKLIADCVAHALFITRFGDGEQLSYRWHSLFAEHCRRIVRQEDPARWRHLNALAATHLRTRYPLEAIRHAIEAVDGSLAVDILADYWLELLLQSRAGALDNACLAVIQSSGESAELLAIRAACRDLAGDAVDAHLLFARSQDLCKTENNSARALFISDLVRILLSADRFDILAAAARAEATLSDHDVVTPSAYACSLFLLGWAHSRLREAQHGADLLRAAVYECRALGLNELAERARRSLAFTIAQTGDFTATMRVVDDARKDTSALPELWLWHDGDGADELARGWVRFWQGEPASALADFQAVSTAAGTGYPDVAKLMFAYAAATLNDASSLGLAETMLERIPDVDSHGVPWTDFKLGGQARLAEIRGEPALALELAAQITAGPHLPTVTVITAGLCRRLGDVDMARRFGEVGRAVVTQPYSQAYALLVLALLEWADGDKPAAHRLLEQALSLCAPQRVLLPFLDNADVQCRELLAAHLGLTAHHAFLAQCRAVTERVAARHVSSAERLTPREIEVLACLRTPMTFAEIAEQLGISVNTFKTHQRAIYRKLGAANRRDAIRLANLPAPERDTDG